jgi:hypothetical protein
MKRILVVCLWTISLTAGAQDRGIFRFMDIPSHARLTGMGGYLISLPGEDVSLVTSNPALALDTLNGYGAFSYLSFFAGSNKVMMAYQDNIRGSGPWFIAAERMGYGDISTFDPAGQYTGETDVSESMVMIGRAHRINHFSMGASVKLVSSSIAGFTANAIMMDLGGVFIHPDRQMNVSLVIRNLGVLLDDYEEGTESELPFDVRAGITFKPEFMPFRFSFTAYRLSTWNDTPTGEEESGTVDEIFRHLNIGAELLLSTNVNIRFGYNHLIRQELRLEEASGLAGLSFGLMFRIKAFELAYSRGGYHAAGGAHNFTVSADMHRLFKKNR